MYRFAKASSSETMRWFESNSFRHFFKKGSPSLTLYEMQIIFEEDKNNDFDEFLAFDRVEPRRSQRQDLHAFMLLDELVPGSSDMVAGAEHDEIYLGVEAEKLASAATREQIIELIRCGVRYDSGTESLCMFA